MLSFLLFAFVHLYASVLVDHLCLHCCLCGFFFDALPFWLLLCGFCFDAVLVLPILFLCSHPFHCRGFSMCLWFRNAVFSTLMLLTLQFFFLKLLLSCCRGFLCLSATTLLWFLLQYLCILFLVLAWKMQLLCILQSFFSQISDCFFLFCGNLSFFALLLKASATCPG